MNVCVVGSGISGLSSAFYLLQYADVGVTVYEQAGVFGGRANVTDDGEHCARVFLSDYDYLFGILRSIRLDDGRSIHDTLSIPWRYCHSAKSGWLRTSHLYPVAARELSVMDKARITLARRESPLLASQNLGPNTNRYGSIRNFSLPSVARMLVNFLKSKVAFILEGPTDECLIGPWVSYLEERGVTLETHATVSLLRPETNGISVRVHDIWQTFDAVVVTAFAPDMTSLLDASGIEHSVVAVDHSHCKCFTVELDPREQVLDDGHPAVYSRRGVTLVLQPLHSRCVVLCTRKCPSTDTDYVLSQVRDYLALEYEVCGIRSRDNLRPDEAIFTADYLDRGRVLPRMPGLFFAGSYIRNSYPVDSGEGAARSAFDVVQRMQEEYRLCRRQA